MIVTFLFFNKSRGIQSFLSFSNEFRHCTLIIHEPLLDNLIHTARGRIASKIYFRAIESDLKERLMPLKKIKSLTAMISVEIEKPIKFKPIIPLIMSCNEICRHVSGVDIGFTFNPLHLYNKLTKIQRVSNFIRFYEWRRGDVR